MTVLLHLAGRRDWEAARRIGRYEMSTRGRTLREVGYIHCSLPRQLAAVAAAVYADADPAELRLLVIDGDLLTVPVVPETSEPDGEAYPHLYGPLPTTAVRSVLSVRRDAAGRLTLADGADLRLAAEPRPGP